MTARKAGARHCSFKKPDGSTCGAWAHQGSSLCYFHDPALATARTENGREGQRRAQASRARAGLDNGDVMLPRDVLAGLLGEEGEEAVRITSTADIKVLLERTLTAAFAGRANAQLMNSITAALREARQLLETEVLERRIEELEKKYGVTL